MNPFIDHELAALEIERHCTNKRLIAYNTKHHLIALYIFIAIFGASAIINAVEVQCPYCDETIEMGCRRQETWICPNQTCRYVNYDGIDHCGLCGTKRMR